MTSDNFNQLLNYLGKEHPRVYAKYQRNFVFSDSGLSFFPPASMADEENIEISGIIDKWADDNHINTRTAEI